MRIVFFGTPDFAVPCLQRLGEHPSAFEVVGVVSQPDRPQGRGQQLSPPPVKVLAESFGIPVWQPQRLRRDEKTLAALSALDADVFVVVAYGQILSPQVLAMPRRGCINVHASLLPTYRGAAPIQWALANGEQETGVTTMLMDEGMDTGPMLLQATLPIHPTWNREDLAQELADLGSRLLITTLEKWQAGMLTPIPQDPRLATYAPLLKPEDFHLHWTDPALRIHNRVRGFYPMAWIPYRGERLKLLATQVGGGDFPMAAPGTIVGVVKGQGFWVQTGQGSLLLTRVQPPGKKAQSGWDFLNGQRLGSGDVIPE